MTEDGGFKPLPQLREQYLASCGAPHHAIASYQLAASNIPSLPSARHRTETAYGVLLVKVSRDADSSDATHTRDWPAAALSCISYLSKRVAGITPTHLGGA